MSEIARNTLATRDELALAIAPWWKRGATRDMIILVLRREGATTAEARAVGQRLAEQVERGRSFLDETYVAAQTELVRAVGEGGIQRSKNPTPQQLQDQMAKAITEVSYDLAAARHSTPRKVMPAIVSTYRENLALTPESEVEMHEYWARMVAVARSLPGGLDPYEPPPGFTPRYEQL